MSSSKKDKPWISNPQSIQDYYLQVIEQLTKERGWSRNKLFNRAFKGMGAKLDNKWQYWQNPSKYSDVTDKLTIQQAYLLATALEQDFPSLIWKAFQRFSK